MSMPLVSLVIPIYNDLPAFQKNAPYLLEARLHWPFASEILVVDDGSDDPQALAHYCRELGLPCLRLPKNFGKGEALRRGMAIADGQILAFTDADIPYNLESFVKMVTAIHKGECDVAVGSRLQGGESPLDRPWLRRMGSWLYAFFLHFIFGLRMEDPQSGLKVFRGRPGKSLFARSTVKGFAIDSEILIFARQEKLRIQEFPIVLRSKDGASVRLFYHGLQMMGSLLSLRRRVSASR